MIKYLLNLLFLVLISCGKASKDDDSGNRQIEIQNEGTYSGVLVAINPKISNIVSGDVKIMRMGDDFRVAVKLLNAPAGLFSQYLHNGSSCPSFTQDINNDGMIDTFESRKATDHAVIPLDGDLSSQAGGNPYFLKGNYRYSEYTSYYLMMSDLRLPYYTNYDGVIKLNSDDLPIDRRVVVIYQQRPSSYASSVAGAEIPIACTLLSKISDDVGPEEPSIPEPRRRIPRSRNRPDPYPVPMPLPTEQTPSWWERLRVRWSNWRSRVNDWWNRDDNRLN